MAHRKPLGSTFTSTFDWAGDFPEPDDYLVSGAGTWYRVAGVEEKSNRAKVGLMLERIAEPAGVTIVADGDQERLVVQVGEQLHPVHPFVWYPRERRRVRARE